LISDLAGVFLQYVRQTQKFGGHGGYQGASEADATVQSPGKPAGMVRLPRISDESATRLRRKGTAVKGLGFEVSGAEVFYQKAFDDRPRRSRAARKSTSDYVPENRGTRESDLAAGDQGRSVEWREVAYGLPNDVRLEMTDE
jgi:hypothetical protein